MSNGSLFVGSRGRSLEGGCLFNIFSLKGGGNSKRGTYLKLGANSSIYGIQEPIDYGLLRYNNNDKERKPCNLGVAWPFFDRQEKPLLNSKQERATVISMIMSHARNVATAISFLIDFCQRLLLLFLFFQFLRLRP